MERTLGNFVSALRKSDLEVSPAETLDAMAALQLIGFSDPVLFRNTLAIVLAKTPEEKVLFQICFDRFFSFSQFDPAGPEGRLQQLVENLGQGDALPGESQRSERVRRHAAARGQHHDSALANLLLQGDHNALALAMQRAASEVHLEQIRTLRERSLYARRMLLHMGIADLDRLIESLQTSADATIISRLQVLREARSYVQEQVQSYVEEQYFLLVDGSGDRFLREAVTNTRLTNMQRYYFEHIREAVAKLAHQLAKRHARKRRIYNKGRLDVRRTIRRNMRYDGALFDLHWRQIKLDPPKVFVICDVSGSVKNVSRFLLTFLYSLGEVLPRVRSFAFSNELGEVTDFFHNYKLDEAIEMSLDDYGKGSTDYGTAFRTFKSLCYRDIDSRSTIIILGDARNNYFANGADVLKDLSRRSRQVIWLNPEPRERWEEGDAEMKAFLPACNFAEVCNSLPDLERMVSRVLRTAH